MPESTTLEDEVEDVPPLIPKKYKSSKHSINMEGISLHSTITKGKVFHLGIKLESKDIISNGTRNGEITLNLRLRSTNLTFTKSTTAPDELVEMLTAPEGA
ncbi:hypothetical protein ACFE04_023470 [Oxalis oulophora]